MALNKSTHPQHTHAHAHSLPSLGSEGESPSLLHSRGARGAAVLCVAMRWQAVAGPGLSSSLRTSLKERSGADFLFPASSSPAENLDLAFSHTKHPVSGRSTLLVPLSSCSGHTPPLNRLGASLYSEAFAWQELLAPFYI